METQTNAAFSQAHSASVNASKSLTDITVVKRSGNREVFDLERVTRILMRIAESLGSPISIDELLKETTRTIYDGITTREIEKALILAAVSMIERDYLYNGVAARLVLQQLYKEVFTVSVRETDFEQRYRTAFIANIKKAISHNILSPELLSFDLDYLSRQLVLERDSLLSYLGLQTLAERYLIKIDKVRLELPQAFWMRIAMGLALQEEKKEECALRFYHLLSQLRYIPSTPTLFHSGYVTAQLSSCYLTTIRDDLGHIFKCMGDNAQLSKWAGGIGNDWTYIRATGSWIKGIHATSQGVVPFLKVANDITVGITRSGIRRGGTCAYLETWHLDIEEFLDLRRNTGDERRRTHDMNTANWIPDLFMKRVLADADWTLFSPEETPDLHDLYGRAFEERYAFYEQLAREGKLRQHRVVSAQKLWRKMLSRLFETGHPWITFKDPSNIRSPQDHAGVVHSSNLCTEITLNTSADETAVCNLGSINLARHVVNGVLDEHMLAESVENGVRMLDNVIDLNFYPTQEARNSNLRHRPVGLGLMGFQDALFLLGIAFDSDEAIVFADRVGELIAYHAISASSKLARERGAYSSYKGSKWDRGIFPIDTLDLLEQERGVKVEVSRSSSLDWEPVREHVRTYGIRNSNIMAVAPTATIANIAGCYPSIEPVYKNLYVKANISGEFTIINQYLVAELKQLNLWDEDMVNELKYFDGDITNITRIPHHIKQKYKTAFECDPLRLVRIAAARAKWIDQSQSFNIFMRGVSGQMLNEIYFAAWRAGLKTTYYLRTLGATQIEKSTLDAKKFGYTQKRDYTTNLNQTAPPVTQQSEQVEQKVKPAASCNVFREDECEACQ